MIRRLNEAVGDLWAAVANLVGYPWAGVLAVAFCIGYPPASRLFRFDRDLVWANYVFNGMGWALLFVLAAGQRRAEQRLHAIERHSESADTHAQIASAAVATKEDPAP